MKILWLIFHVFLLNLYVKNLALWFSAFHKEKFTIATGKVRVIQTLHLHLEEVNLPSAFFTGRISMKHYPRETIVGLQLWLPYTSLYFVTYLNEVFTAAAFVFF